MGRVTGRVLDRLAGRAVVECDVAGAPGCASCAGGRGCGWRRRDSTHRLELDASGSGLQPGDRVDIEVDDRRLLGAAARLYLPPVAGLIFGPALLRLLELDQGTAPLLAAFAGLALGLAVARGWARRAPVAVRIGEHASAEAPPA